MSEEKSNKLSILRHSIEFCTSTHLTFEEYQQKKNAQHIKLGPFLYPTNFFINRQGFHLKNSEPWSTVELDYSPSKATPKNQV
jgi:hypothetical protein